MPEPQAGTSFTPRMSALIVALMLAMVAVPTGITLHTVRSPVKLVPTSPDPSPYGYTWSLLLFIVPIAVLVGIGLVPSASFFPVARPFINWRAFSLTFFLILLISLLWEATLAIPYGWWGYQSNQMMGVFIGAWAGLPIEAVCVWIAVTYATAILFEVVKLYQAGRL